MRSAGDAAGNLAPATPTLSSLPASTRAGPLPVATGRSARVLLVDDDVGACDTVASALRREGFHVTTCCTGRTAIDAARTSEFDVAILDLHLPDMPGIEVLRAVTATGSVRRTLLLSGFLTVRDCAEAMRLGTRDALEKPVGLNEVLVAVRRCLGNHLSDAAVPQHSEIDIRPRSAADRWAMLVLQACRSEGDLKTLGDWATFVGVSYSSLREHCYVLGLQPHKARDFMRALRAAIHAPRHKCEPTALLDMADHRTLERFIDAAGPGFVPRSTAVPPVQFVRFQRFIPPEHEGIRFLLIYIQDMWNKGAH